MKLSLTKVKGELDNSIIMNRARQKINEEIEDLNRQRNPGVSNPWPMGHLRPRMAMNAAQHKTVNLLKTFSFAHQFSLVFVY